MMDAIDLLLSRQSAVRLEAPGPDAEALDRIFRSALRAPDHGRLRPWRFIVVPEDRREQLGELLAGSLRAREPDASDEALRREREKALRAPVIVVAAARVLKGHKIPEIEQMLSAGAAAQAIMLAANAQGFGAMWKTGAPAYDPMVKAALGLDPDDAIVAFIYVGTQAGEAAPARVPAVEDHVAVWTGGAEGTTTQA